MAPETDSFPHLKMADNGLATITTRQGYKTRVLYKAPLISKLSAFVSVCLICIFSFLLRHGARTHTHKFLPFLLWLDDGGLMLLTIEAREEEECKKWGPHILFLLSDFDDEEGWRRDGRSSSSSS